MKKLITIVSVPIAMFMAACSAPGPAVDPSPTITVTTPGPTVTVTATPEPKVVRLRYDTAKDFRDALVDAGLGCDDWELEIENLSGMCGDVLIFTIEDDSAKQRNMFQATLSLAWNAIMASDGTKVGLFVTENGFARVNADDAYALQDALDGGVVLTSGERDD